MVKTGGRGLFLMTPDDTIIFFTELQYTQYKYTTPLPRAYF